MAEEELKESCGKAGCSGETHVLQSVEMPEWQQRALCEDATLAPGLKATACGWVNERRKWSIWSGDWSRETGRREGMVGTREADETQHLNTTLHPRKTPLNLGDEEFVLAPPPLTRGWSDSGRREMVCGDPEQERQ